MGKKCKRRDSERQVGTSNDFTRYAIAFLVIYLLLGLLIPQDSKQ